MRKLFFIRALTAVLASAYMTVSAAEDQRFHIARFQVDGNTLLPDAEVQHAVAPLAGPERVYGDIQKALEALEVAYRKAGFSAVQVYVPEQELSTGVVRIQVTESVLGKVTISGARYFDNDNVRGSLPALKEGRPPNLRDLSEGIQLVNDNPAKQVEVTLGIGAEEGRVDAKVAVTESNPQRIFFTLDNTGAPASGRWRIGAAWQHANLFNRDHVATLAYTTSPDSPGGVHVDLYSVGYRIPLYALGDSLDFIYGSSSVNTPGTSPTLGGALGIVGKGDVYGVRWNHFFARQGDYTGKLVFAIDYKYINSRCSNNGVEISFAPPTPPISSCVPYTTRPLSVTYLGQRQRANELFDYYIGVARNWALGLNYTNLDGRIDRYSYLTPGNRSTQDDFVVVRGGSTYFKGLQNDWQIRLAGNLQYTSNPLLSSEQFGLAGSTAVRGFNERAVAADSGVIVNAEIYTPELAAKIRLPGNLRLLAFYDVGRGYNNHIGTSATPSQVSVASVGGGLRYVFSRDFNLRADVARVRDAGTSTSESRGDWRGHISMLLGF